MVLDISSISYPHFSSIANLWPSPSRLLGEEIVWEAKLDGSCIGAYLDVEGNVRLRSRRFDDADPTLYAAFKSCDEAGAVEELLREAPRWGSEYVVFGELCQEGISPARSRKHERTSFCVFDIWSKRAGWFVPYTAVHQQCHHFGLPIAPCYGITRSTTMEQLFEVKDGFLEIAKEDGMEGVVGKVWNPVNKVGDTPEHNRWIIFKEKHDTPKFERLKRIVSGEPQFPALEESEVYSAIDAVRLELGGDFSNVRVAMPRVASAINEEMKKHFRGPPEKKLFVYYQEVLKDEIGKSGETP